MNICTGFNSICPVDVDLFQSEPKWWNKDQPHRDTDRWLYPNKMAVCAVTLDRKSISVITRVEFDLSFVWY